MNKAPAPKWNHSPSPKDGKQYRTLMRNFQDDQWESTAFASPTAANGWENGPWQDRAREVKAWRPMDNAT